MSHTSSPRPVTPPTGTRRCQPVPEEVRRAADLLERRWQLSIIYAALTGALRFSEFAESPLYDNATWLLETT